MTILDGGPRPNFPNTAKNEIAQIMKGEYEI